MKRLRVYRGRDGVACGWRIWGVMKRKGRGGIKGKDDE